MAIDAVTEEIASNLEEAAEATRRVDTRGVGFFLGGVLVGAAVGFYIGYRFNREKIRAELFVESQAEVEKIRSAYAARAAQDKPTVEEVIEQRGYSKKEPTTTKKKSAVRKTPARPTRPPVPAAEPVGTWDYLKEVESRSSDAPYVIHQDEFAKSETGYTQVVYTYYATDDVLTDVENHPLPHPDVVVGQDNLRFGHGTDDEDVVFVRNEHMELEMEICRVAKSYEQEVLGLENDNPT